MRNLAFKVLHGVEVAVHNVRNPSREEWEAHTAMTVAIMRAAGGDLANFRQLIFTDGGGPNGAQRKASANRFRACVNGDKIKVAVVSRSTAVRGIVTAFRWLGLPMRSFEPEQLAEAFAFLAVSNAEAVDLCAAVEELCATVDGPTRSAARVPAYRIELSAGSPEAPRHDSIAPTA
ncbi:MAG: STAS/SEC14 domain-containing protein [Byssovorax sp.]